MLAALASGSTVYIPDVATEDRWPTWSADVTAAKIRSVLHVPMKAGDQVIGVLAAGLAQSAEWLVAARVGQGVAASFAIPSTLALLVADYPDPAGRTRAIALYSAVIGAGCSVSIVIGGVFTDLLSWRWGAAAGCRLYAGHHVKRAWLKTRRSG
jgi:MFS family permease